MRIMKIVFITLLVIIIVLSIGVFTFLKTFDLNRFKKQITEKISKTIDRDVTMKHVSLDFSIFRGITFHMSGLAIMDHPHFSKQPMLYVDTSHLSLDTFSFLVKHQIMISEIELDSPKVTIIRDDRGEINFQNIFSEESSGRQAKGPGALSFAGDVMEDAVKENSKDFSLEEMFIRSMHVKDGTLTFFDYTSYPSTMVSLKEIDFRISDLSLEEPFPFEVKAALFNDRENIHLSGLTQIDMQNGQLRIDDVKMPLDLSSFSMDAVYEGVPMLKDVGLIGGVSGQMAIDIHQMILGSQGLLVLSADGHLSGVNMKFKSSPLPVEDLEILFSMTDSNMDLQKMTLPLASGEISMEGRVVDYLSDRKFSADLKLTDIPLNELGRTLNLPATLEGQLSGKYKFNGSATDPMTLQSSLSGEGSLDIKNGRIKDINLLRAALDKISFIPGLERQIETNLPERYKEKLTAKDTVLEKAQMDTTISEGIMYINEAELMADGFSLLARGLVDGKQNLVLETDLYVPSGLSSYMVSASEELEYFLTEDRRIHIPMRPYNGPLTRFRTYPDVEDIGKQILRNRGKQELKKVLFKALDIDEKNSQETLPEGSDSSAQSQPESQGGVVQDPESSSEEVIIENILDMIPVFE